MPNKKLSPKDEQLKAALAAGGRKGAETDFNTILKRAIKPGSTKPKPKTK
jgi:hypothetical protein